MTVFIIFKAMSGFSEIDNQSDSLILESSRLANALEIESNINNATVVEKNMLLSTNAANRPAYRQEFESYISEALAAIDRNIELADTPQRKQGNEKIKQDITKFAELSRQSMQLVEAGQVEMAQELSKGEARDLRRAISKDVDERVQRNKQATEA